MSRSPRIGVGAALSAGLRLTSALSALLFLLIGARAAQAIVEATFGPAFVVALGGDAQAALGTFGAFAALWLVAELAGACLLAYAAVSAATRLGGNDASAARWPSLALGLFLVGGAVRITAQLWVWTALGATLTAWVRALLLREAGVVASFALALALTVSLPLGLFATTWIRTALARAAVQGTGYVVSLSDTIAALRQRPLPPLVIVFTTGAVAFGVSIAVGGAFVPLTPRFDAPAATELGWAAAVLSGAITAAGVAFAQLWGILALTTLAAAPASAAPVPMALPVGETADDAPIVDAAPVPRDAPDRS